MLVVNVLCKGPILFLHRKFKVVIAAVVVVVVVVVAVSKI